MTSDRTSGPLQRTTDVAGPLGPTELHPAEPHPTDLRPTDLRAAAAALAEGDGPLRIRGAGTAANWAGAPEPARILDTTALSGVLAYNPGDLTIAVLAGTPVTRLTEVLAEHDQRIAFDAARIRRGATVGGLIATGDAGPAGYAYGSLRDLVIGATVVWPDGTVARSGGHVIKNVAGYDLAKLLHGAYGVLGLLAEVVLRLHPRPRATVTLATECAVADAAALTAEVLSSALEPVALEWCATSAAEGTLLVRLEGTEDGVTARAATLARMIGARKTHDADARWRRHAELTDPLPGQESVAVLRIGCRPSRLIPLLDRLFIDGVIGAVTAGPATGIATVTVPAEAAVVARAHAAVGELGGTSVLRHRPEGSELPAWGQIPSAARVFAAIKREFDPRNRLGTGRFAPWL